MDFSTIKGKLKLDSVPKDVIGIDFGACGTRIVRMVSNKAGVTVTQAWETDDELTDLTVLPRGVRSRACALAVSHPEAVAKLLSIPRPANKLDDVPFAELLGVDNPMAFRMAMEIQDSSANETSALLAAIPLSLTEKTMGLFAQGFPAPQSLELSGLAALNGVMMTVPSCFERSVILLELGADTATVAITIPQKLAFLRQFRIGANPIMRKLRESLGMDDVTVREAVGGEMIDASEQVRVAFEPLMRQIALGRDFVARRHNVRATRLYACGGLFQTPFWLQPFANGLGVEAEAWNPFKAIPVSKGSVTKEQIENGTRFAAAAGVALAVLKGGQTV